MLIGRYRITAIRYHAALPIRVQRLNVGDKDVFGIWGYEIKKTEIPAGKSYQSENCEKLMRELIVNQIRTDGIRVSEDKLVHIVLEMNLESMPIEQSQPSRTDDSIEEHCCPDITELDCVMNETLRSIRGK
jgi:hypothetical protein